MDPTPGEGGEETRRSFDEQVTRGVTILLGDPEVAVRRLAGPMIVAMLLVAVYNLADAIWVSGLGSDALAGVGFITPLFMILMGLSNGLGAGATSAVARCIGARDREGADNAASHAIFTAFLVSTVLTVLFVLFLRPIMMFLGAGPVADIAVEYGQIVFLGTVFFLVVQMAYAVLRAEGDTRRTMYAIAISSVLNIVLDPILIYWAGLGVAGAAIATVISIASVLVVLAYWFLVRRDTFVSLKIRGFSLDVRILRSILGVGIPASIEYLLLSAMSLSINLILVTIAGTDAVAVYTSGWRIVMFAIVPLIGIAVSVIAVSGAAYGAREYEKIHRVHRYSIRIGVAIGLLTGLLTYLLSPQITALFTYSPGSAHLSPAFILFFHTMCLFYPFIPLGMFSASVFQGTGHGVTSLVISLLRTIAFNVLFAYTLGIALGLGELGVYLGIVAGNITGGLVGYLWAGVFIGRLMRMG